MKKGSIMLGALLVYSLSTSLPAISAEISAQTHDTYGSAGCGLGSMVFGNEPGWSQVFAATTNATGIQTFGITSGTSNCGKGIVNTSKNADLSVFVQANFDNLAKEMAKGSGESLAAMAELAGVSAAERPAFYAALQQNFTSIFPSEKVEVSEVVNHVTVLASK